MTLPFLSDAQSVAFSLPLPLEILGSLSSGTLSSSWCLHIEVMALRAVGYRRLMNMVAARTRDVTQVRGVWIRLILGGLGGNIRVAAMAFGACSSVRRLCGRTLCMTGAAIETCGDVLVDQKAVSSARSGRRLRIYMGRQHGCDASEYQQGNSVSSAHYRSST